MFCDDEWGDVDSADSGRTLWAEATRVDEAETGRTALLALEKVERCRSDSLWVAGAEFGRTMGETGLRADEGREEWSRAARCWADGPWTCSCRERFGWLMD